MNGSCERAHAGSPAPAALSDAEHISLCETLDRVLNKGVVIGGEIVISVADIDLVYLGLQAVLTSVETARRTGIAPAWAEGRMQSAKCRMQDAERRTRSGK